MLLELEVKNFALVDHLVLEFAGGLTVLTGETGAGKSIILDSLSFLLGNSPKGSNSKRACRVAGRFQPTEAVLEYLQSQGLPSDEEELLIVRERKEGGRTSSRLNGSLVSINQLKSLAGQLVDLHGQHQSYGLTRPSTHLPMLDRMAGVKHAKELAKYQRLYQERLELLTEIREIQTAERDRAREMEWLKMELEEIDKVAPKASELRTLEEDVKRLGASEELSQGAQRACASLGQEGGVIDLLNGALAALSPLQSFDQSLSSAVQRVESAEIELQEVYREISEYAESIEHDPQALDRLQQRAESIKSLCRKFGPTTADVLAYRKASRDKLQRFENADQVLAELSERDEKIQEKLRQSAKRLSKARRRASAELGTELVAELSQLAMPEVAFQVEFQNTTDFGPQGCEQAQFLFSPNPGRPPSPLAETASGGELSRVMLALVTILSRFQNQPTLIFDEIDVGLGGRTAEAVATKLSRLAQKVQVLCVTHLPVVAAAGAGHLVVEKTSDKKSTTVKVSEVTGDERVEEVARMLSGGVSQLRARELATEMLARREKEASSHSRSAPTCA